MNDAIVMNNVVLVCLLINKVLHSTEPQPTAQIKPKWDEKFLMCIERFMTMQTHPFCYQSNASQNAMENKRSWNNFQQLN